MMVTVSLLGIGKFFFLMGNSEGNVTQWLIKEGFVTEEDKVPYHEFGGPFGESEKAVQVIALGVSPGCDESIFVLNNQHFLAKCDIESGVATKTIGPIFNDSDFPDHLETDHLYQETLIMSRDFLFVANNFKENKNILLQYSLELELLKSYDCLMGNPLESVVISPDLENLVFSDIEGFLKIFSIPLTQLGEKPRIPEIEKLKKKEERRDSNLAMAENRNIGEPDLDSRMVYDGKDGVFIN
jgi:hypothetical protein